MYSTTIQHLSPRLCILIEVKPQQRLGCISVGSQIYANQLSLVWNFLHQHCLVWNFFWGEKPLLRKWNRCPQIPVSDPFIEWVGEPNVRDTSQLRPYSSQNKKDFECAPTPTSWKPGFAIITWNNPKKLEKPWITKRQYLAIFRVYFIHGNEVLMVDPGNKSEDLGVDPNVSTPNQHLLFMNCEVILWGFPDSPEAP